MATIEKRIENLGKALLPVEWEKVELRIYVKDCSKPGDGKPERLAMVTKSGTPARHGLIYYRETDETETTFLDRIEAQEAVRAREYLDKGMRSRKLSNI